MITKQEYTQGNNQTTEKSCPNLLPYQFPAQIAEITNKIHDDCSNRLIMSEVASSQHYVQTLTELVLKQMQSLADTQGLETSH